MTQRIEVHESCDGFDLMVYENGVYKVFRWDHNELDPGRVVHDLLKHLEHRVEYIEDY